MLPSAATFVDAQLTGTLWTYVREGGPVMWPILAFSVVGLALVIERSIVFRRARVDVRGLLAELRRALLLERSAAAAVAACERRAGPVAAMLRAGLARLGRPLEEVDKALESAALYETARLERGLPVLATTANVTPLLGFLGTVTGMIRSFDALARAGLADPGAVADGIAEALITTAAGLLVAIPVQVAHNYFLTRVNLLVREMESAGNVLLETLGEMAAGSDLEARAPGVAATPSAPRES